ncbi:zinc metalloprotease HtpX [Candidatus Woesearchaeota archaeon]|nr:zinc metalloprotease HtpX [Candidatus Woesearchaeota archaeon]
MQSFYEQIRANKVRTYFLMVSFSLLVIILGYLLGIVLVNNGFTGMIIAFFFGIIYMVLAYNQGSDWILAMSHAKPVSKKQDPFLVNTVEGLAIAAGIPTPKVYMIEEDSINAFATGKDEKHSVVCITSGARKKLSRLELEGVIAHEISHIKNRDVKVMMLAAVLVGVVVMISDIMLRSFWFSRRDERRDSGLMILIALVLALLAPLIAQIIKLAISRQREFLADASAVKLTRYPKGLADALRKIKNDTDKVVDTANRSTAHLYIENPLRHKNDWISKLFSTHPPIDERIKRLEAMM